MPILYNNTTGCSRYVNLKKKCCKPRNLVVSQHLTIVTLAIRLVTLVINIVILQIIVPIQM